MVDIDHEAVAIAAVSAAWAAVIVRVVRAPTGEEDGDEDRHSSGEDHCGPDADDRADAQGRSLHSAAVASVVHDDAPAR
jgi:hypothetical protein